MARVLSKCGADCIKPYPLNEHAEAAHRRMPNRSGLAARFSRYGPRMQGYCAEDTNFARFGDASVIVSLNTSKSGYPGTTSPLASSNIFGRACAPYPPCNDTVDLIAGPFRPCVRANIDQRVAIVGGYGEELRWPIMASKQHEVGGHSTGRRAADLPHVVYFPGGRGETVVTSVWLKDFIKE